MLLSFLVYYFDPFLCKWIPVELKCPLVLIHKVSIYCSLKLLLVQCSSHVTTLSKYIHISKYSAIDSSFYINSKFQTGCSYICCSLYTNYYILEFSKMCDLVYIHKQYAEISRTYQNIQGQNKKACKQLDLFLITYLHWWCNIINNKKYSLE